MARTCEMCVHHTSCEKKSNAKLWMRDVEKTPLFVTHPSCYASVRGLSHLIIRDSWRRTGWSLSFRERRDLSRAAREERGKSELRRAVCRITSGRMDLNPFDGKCHRKHTAPACRGKGEKVR